MSEGWLVVETLDGAARASVVADGARRKDWSSPLRARPGTMVGAAIQAVVGRCCVSRTAVHRTVPARRGAAELTIIGRPVVGAHGVVHAVQVWTGPTGVPVPAPRHVAGWAWDCDRSFAILGPNVEEWFHGTAADPTRRIQMATENFHHIERIDDIDGYLAVLAGAATRWQGMVTFVGEDGDRREAHTAVRRIEGPEPLVRGLFHDVTDVTPADPMPMPAAARLLAGQLDRGSGWVFVPNGVVYDWITPPLPPLDGWQQHLPEFRDRAPYDLAIAQIGAGAEHTACTVSLRFPDGDWIDTDTDIFGLAHGRIRHGLIQVRQRTP